MKRNTKKNKNHQNKTKKNFLFNPKKNNYWIIKMIFQFFLFLKIK